jgi:hypothetical protein
MELVESNCVKFDGIDDLVLFTAFGTFGFTGTHSFACWFRNDANLGANQHIIGRAWSNNQDIYLTSAGNAVFRHVGTTITTSSTYSDGVWHFAAGSIDRENSITLFKVDDELKQTGIATTTTDAGSYFTFGKAIHSGLAASAFPYQGYLANAMIFTSALTESQINTLKLNTFPSTPLLHCPLAEGGGTQAFDISGNGYSGILTNVTLSSFRSTENDTYHYNIENGFDLYGTDIRVPYVNGSAITTPSTATLTSSHPAGYWHNNAETKIKINPANDADILAVTGLSDTAILSYTAITTGLDNTAEGYFFVDDNTENKMKNILIYSSAQTYLKAIKVHRYINNYDNIIKIDGQPIYDPEGNPIWIKEL